METFIIRDRLVKGDKNSDHYTSITPIKWMLEYNVDISHIPVKTMGNDRDDINLINDLLQFKIKFRDLDEIFAA